MISPEIILEKKTVEVLILDLKLSYHFEIEKAKFFCVIFKTYNLARSY